MLRWSNMISGKRFDRKGYSSSVYNILCLKYFLLIKKPNLLYCKTLEQFNNYIKFISSSDCNYIPIEYNTTLTTKISARKFGTKRKCFSFLVSGNEWYEQNAYIKVFIIQKHGPASHTRLSTWFGGQEPWFVVRLYKVRPCRCLIWNPLPQLALQTLHSVHGLIRQSVAIKKFFSVLHLVSWNINKWKQEIAKNGASGRNVQL